MVPSAGGGGRGRLPRAVRRGDPHGPFAAWRLLLLLLHLRRNHQASCRNYVATSYMPTAHFQHTVSRQLWRQRKQVGERCAIKVFTFAFFVYLRKTAALFFSIVQLGGRRWAWRNSYLGQKLGLQIDTYCSKTFSFICLHETYRIQSLSSSPLCLRLDRQPWKCFSERWRGGHFKIYHKSSMVCSGTLICYVSFQKTWFDVLTSSAHDQRVKFPSFSNFCTSSIFFADHTR